MEDSKQKELKEFIKRALHNSIDDVFERVHKFAETKSGDISVEQVVMLEKMKEEMAALIFEQVTQNLD